MDHDALARGRAFEREFAERTGARPMPASGNQWFASMDLEGATVVWSLKDSIRLLHLFSLFEEVQHEVLAPGGRGEGTIPALALRGRGPRGDRVLAVMDVDDMVKILSEKRTVFQQSKAEARVERANTVELFREEDA